MNNVEFVLRTEIKDHFGIEIKIGDDTALGDDLGFDSLDYIELLMIAEESFNIEITDEDAEKVRTFGEFVALVNSLKV